MLPGRKYTIDQILGLLVKGRWIIAATVFLGVFGGLLVSRTLADIYAAQATVQVLPQRVPDAYVRATVTSTVEERLKTIEGLIRSRTQLEQVITDFNLFPEYRAANSMDNAVAAANKALTVEVAAGGGRSPADARTGHRVHGRLRLSGARRRAQGDAAPHRQPDRRELADARDRRGSDQPVPPEPARRRRAPAARTGPEARGLPAALRRPPAQSAGQQPAGTAVGADGAAAALARASPAIATAGASSNGSTRARSRIWRTPRWPRRRLRPARAPIRTRSPRQAPRSSGSPSRATTSRSSSCKFKPEHPDIKRAKNQIRDLEQQAAAEAASRPATTGGDTVATGRAVSPELQSRRERLREQKEEINSLGRQIAQKEAQEALLRGRMGDYQGRIESIPAIESEWNELTRDNITLQETYKTLLGRSEESKISANLERRQIGEQFRMLDAAAHRRRRDRGPAHPGQRRRHRPGPRPGPGDRRLPRIPRQQLPHRSGRLQRARPARCWRRCRSRRRPPTWRATAGSSAPCT